MIIDDSQFSYADCGECRHLFSTPEAANFLARGHAIEGYASYEGSGNEIRAVPFLSALSPMCFFCPKRFNFNSDRGLGSRRTLALSRTLLMSELFTNVAWTVRRCPLNLRACDVLYKSSVRVRLSQTHFQGKVRLLCKFLHRPAKADLVGKMWLTRDWQLIKIGRPYGRDTDSPPDFLLNVF